MGLGSPLRGPRPFFQHSRTPLSNNVPTDNWKITQVMDLNHSGRISKRSVGQFDPNNWISEGDGLLASSAKTRKIWTNHRQTFSQNVQVRESRNRDRASDWSLLTGLPRASMLLLAYSVEMYLKAGLAKAYLGCSEEMFERDVKGRFGHKLVLLAKEIAFPLEDEDGANLTLLREMMVVDARYPVVVPSGASYAGTVNQQTGRIWSSKNSEALTALAKRVKDHSQTIDADRNNPAFAMSVTVDDDGYLAFRAGGNLPSRITYRLSSFQKCTGETSPNDMKAVFASPAFHQLRFHWERAWIYEDGEKKTSCRRRPSRP